MSKAALIEVIRKATECSAAQANDAVDACVEAVVKTVKKEGNFSLVGFGTFKSARRAARKGRNPKTGAEIQIAASKTVRFKPSAQLKARI